MNLSLNKFERAAILFMLVAALGFVLSMTGLASRNGWFERKLHFTTTLDTSEGIREGSPIEMAGVRVGSVTAVEFDRDNRVRLKLSIRRRFAERLHADSRLEIFRPFVIGDKTLAVFPGTAGEPVLADHSEIRAMEVPSLAEFLDGRRLVPYFKTFTDSLEAMKAIAEILVRDNHPAEIAKAFGRLPALLASADEMSRQVGHLAGQLGRGDQLAQTMTGLRQVVDALNRALPALESSAPSLGKDVGALVANLAALTTELNKIAPEFPKSSKRVGEALDEAVVVLKAMQKSFLLSSSVRQVREEEEAARQPASAPHPEK